MKKTLFILLALMVSQTTDAAVQAPAAAHAEQAEQAEAHRKQAEEEKEKIEGASKQQREDKKGQWAVNNQDGVSNALKFENKAYHTKEVRDHLKPATKINNAVGRATTAQIGGETVSLHYNSSAYRAPAPDHPIKKDEAAPAVERAAAEPPLAAHQVALDESKHYITNNQLGDKTRDLRFASNENENPIMPYEYAIENQQSKAGETVKGVEKKLENTTEAEHAAEGAEGRHEKNRGYTVMSPQTPREKIISNLRNANMKDVRAGIGGHSGTEDTNLNEEWDTRGGNNLNGSFAVAGTAGAANATALGVTHNEGATRNVDASAGTVNLIAESGPTATAKDDYRTSTKILYD